MQKYIYFYRDKKASLKHNNPKATLKITYLYYLSKKMQINILNKAFNFQLDKI